MHRNTETTAYQQNAFFIAKVPFLLAISLVTALAFLLSSAPASAAWNSPTCNPDDVDPTDSTCNVSAPVNVSDADQVKTGELEVHNTVSAEDLIINNSFSGTGNGTVSITTSTGDAVTIVQDDTTAVGLGIEQPVSSSGQTVDVNAFSSADGVNIEQIGTGNALQLTQSNTSAFGLRSDARGWFRFAPTNAPVLYIQNTNTTTATSPGTGIAVRVQPAGISPISSYATPDGTGVESRAYSGYGGFFGSVSDTGVYGVSTGGDGVSGISNNAGSSGVVGINDGGGAGFGVYAEVDTADVTAAALRAQNDNATAHSTLQVYQGGLTPATIPGGGAAADVQTNVGYGGYFASTDPSIGVGIIGTGTSGGVNGYTTTGAYGVFGSNSSSTGHAGYFSASGTSGAAVYAASTNYYGVYSSGGTIGVYGTTTSSTDSGVYGENANSGTAAYGVRGENTGAGKGYGGYFAIGSTDASAGAALFENAKTGNGIKVYAGGITPAGYPGSAAAIDSQTDTGHAVNAQSSDSGVYAGRFIGNGGGIVGATPTSGKNAVVGAHQSIGGEGFAGDFSHDTSSSTGNAAALRAQNTDSSAPYVAQFYAAGVATGSTTKNVIPIVGKTVLDVQTNVGHGLYARTTQSDSAAVMGVAESGAVSYGGYFEANGLASSAVYVEQNSTVGIGVEVIHYHDTGVEVISASGVSLNIEQTRGTGIVVTVDGGTTLNSGISVDTSNATSLPGITVNPTEFGVAYNADNSGEFLSSGAYRGGQFYPGDHTSTTTRKDNAVEQLENISYGGLDSGNVWAGGLAYAAGDIWLGGGASSTYSDGVTRYNAETGLETINYGKPSGVSSWDPSVLVQADDKMYAFPAVSRVTVKYAEMDLYTDDISFYTLSTLSTTAPVISSAAFDGTDIWIGAQDTVYTLTPGGTTLTEVTSLTGTLDHAVDMIYADGYMWVLDQGDPTSSTYAGGDAIYKVDVTSGNLSSTIDVGDDPKKMVFDGAHLWTANVEEGGGSSDSLSRVDITTELVEELSIKGDVYDVTFDGSNIWVAMEGAIAPYYISAEGSGNQVTISGSSVIYNDIIFDGTYLWGSDGSVLHKHSIGAGVGHAGMSLISNGVIIKDASNGNLYCVYVSSGSVVEDVYDSSTSTPCNR